MLPSFTVLKVLMKNSRNIQKFLRLAAGFKKFLRYVQFVDGFCGGCYYCAGPVSQVLKFFSRNLREGEGGIFKPSETGPVQ